MVKRKITSKEKALAIIKAYENNAGWEQKVRRMTPWQIYAIYDNLVKRGIIYYDDKMNICYRTPEEAKQIAEMRKELRNGDCHQITLKEYFGERLTQKEK